MQLPKICFKILDKDLGYYHDESAVQSELCTQVPKPELLRTYCHERHSLVWQENVSDIRRNSKVLQTVQHFNFLSHQTLVASSRNTGQKSNGVTDTFQRRLRTSETETMAQKNKMRTHRT